MVTKDQLLEVLPVREEAVIAKEDRQGTDDIRNEMMIAHQEYAGDYDLISHYFNTGDIVDTSRQIFDFLKRYVPYTKESGGVQTVKNPRAILVCNDDVSKYHRVDCKNYASFIAGIIDSIKRENGGQWDWCYKFVSYDQNDKQPGHVFVAVKIGEKELWIDPVFTYFNDGDMHEWEIEEKPGIGGLYRVIAGPNDNAGGQVTVNAAEAATNFLIALNLDLFALKDLFKRYPEITNSPQFQQALNLMGVPLNTFYSFLAH